jgi:glycosyltransferase involved in cell wall biosynthesis
VAGDETAEERSVTGLRIAYVINSLEGGGAALPVPDVVSEMWRAGAEVRLFALSRRNGLAARTFDAAGIDYRTSAAGKSDHVHATAWLWSELRAYKPNVIWTSLTQATAIGQLLGCLLRIPVVSWQHNAFLKPANQRLLGFTRGLTRLWIADSQSVARLTASRFGVSDEDILTWPLFKADPAAPVAQECPDGVRFRIGTLGRLHPNKGYDILIEALGLVHSQRPDLSDQFEVCIGGEGEERSRLSALADGFGVGNLIMAGFQSDPQAFLASCHGYVQPSRGEGFCIAAHEAMQAGLPTIVSDVGQMALTVQDGVTGWIVPREDAPSLAQAMLSMLDDHRAAHLMGLAARSQVLDIYGGEAFSGAGQAILERVRSLIG